MSQTLRASVIGHPISHSLSPNIFGFIASEEKVALDYDAVEVPEGKFQDFLQRLRADQSYIGANVTLPLKEIALKHVDQSTPGVEALGAVNVIFHKEDKLFGLNTDLIGIEKTLSSQSFLAHGASCLLWGAGGAARAVAYILGIQKAKYVAIFNKSARGKDLAAQFGSLFPETKFEFIADLKEVRETEFDLTVNATPLGMTGRKSGEAYFSPSKELRFSKNALAFDLIYTPEDTDFLKVNRALGLRTVSGLEMFIDQALATWKIWIGNLSDEARLHERLRAFLRGVLKLRQDTRSIFISGFMGAGKSAVAQELGRILERTVWDTDKIVEQNTQKTIAEIFAESEDDFRRHESFAVRQTHFESNSVVSLGGGALMKEDNLKLIKKANGILVYLRADVGELQKRIAGQGVTRPLLQGLSALEQKQKMEGLFEARRAVYEKASVQVDTSRLGLKATAYEVISEIGRQP